jgi:H+/gluconate symporter-like permease
VIAALPAFDIIRESVLSIGGGNPLISLAVAVNVLAAMTGSASGGMSIALDVLGNTYVQLAQETGVSLDAMHRVTAVASGALDALPHNGAVIISGRPGFSSHRVWCLLDEVTGWFAELFRFERSSGSKVLSF